MSFFDDFLEEELDLIISLPYRVGVWMAHVDDVETDRDDHMEIRALESILKAISKADKTAPFVAAVVEQTLTFRYVWDEWAALPGFERDVTRAARMVEERMPEGTGRNYRRALWLIALTVARAWGEFKGSEDDLSDEMVLGGVINRLMDRLHDADEGAPENISPAEAEALRTLRAALQG